MSKNFIEEAELIFERNYKPSLKILLKEEVDEEVTEDTDEPLKDTDLGDESEEESATPAGEEGSTDDTVSNEEEVFADTEDEEEEDILNDNAVDNNRSFLKKITNTAKKLRDKYVKNPAAALFNVLSKTNESVKEKHYSKGSIKRFLFEQEEDEGPKSKELEKDLEDTKDILDNTSDFINSLKDIDIMEFVDEYVNTGVYGYKNFDNLFDKSQIIKSAAADAFISMSPMQAEEAIEAFNEKLDKALSEELGIDSPDVLDNDDFKNAIGARSTG